MDLSVGVYRYRVVQGGCTQGGMAKVGTHQDGSRSHPPHYSIIQALGGRGLLFISDSDQIWYGDVVEYQIWPSAVIPRSRHPEILRSWILTSEI